jgi:putative tricarboxylic transport membrane protein
MKLPPQKFLRLAAGAALPALSRFAPKGTQKPILDRLTDALDRALDDERTRKRLIELANDRPEKSRRGQQALRVFLKNEIAPWTPIIQAANVKAE